MGQGCHGTQMSSKPNSIEERMSSLYSLSSNYTIPSEHINTCSSNTSHSFLLTRRINRHELIPHEQYGWGYIPTGAQTPIALNFRSRNSGCRELSEASLRASFPFPPKPDIWKMRINSQRPNFKQPEIDRLRNSFNLSFQESSFSSKAPHDVGQNKMEENKATKSKVSSTFSPKKDLVNIEKAGQNCFMEINSAESSEYLEKFVKRGSSRSLEVNVINKNGNLGQLLASPVEKRTKIDQENFITDVVKHTVWEVYLPSTIIYEGDNEIRRVKNRESGAIRILKRLPKYNNINKDTSEVEYNFLKKLNHPNIIRIFKHFQDKKFHYLILECCEGGNLLQRMKATRQRFSEHTAARIIRQVLCGIAYLHSQKIAHRDLKLENVLFLNNSRDSPIKIIDFGFATEIKGKATEKLGTTEQIKTLHFSKDQKCDIWSLGVMLYMMLSNTTPFAGRTERIITNQVWKGVYYFNEESFKGVSEKAIEFVKQLMEFNPALRLSANQALKNTWLTNYSNYLINEKPKQTKKALKKLLSFYVENDLQRVTLSYLIAKLQDSSGLEIYKRLFEYIDLDQDGVISLSDLNEAWKLYVPKQPLDYSNYCSKKIIKQVDTNRNGFIDYHEFLVASYPLSDLLTESNIWNAFNAFKCKKSENITQESLEKVLGNRGSILCLGNFLCVNEDTPIQHMQIQFPEYSAILYKLLGPITPDHPQFIKYDSEDDFSNHANKALFNN